MENLKNQIKLTVLNKPEVRNDKTRIRILMYGGQEVGKSYLTKILTRNLQCFRINGRHLSYNYDDFAYDGAEESDAILIDDIPVTVDQQNIEFLKKVLKDPELTINRRYRKLGKLSFQSIFVNTNLHFSQIFPNEENLSDYFDYVIHFEDQNTFYDCCKNFKIPLKFL